MSKRSQEKRITKSNRTLKFLREQAGLSFRAAAKASGMNMAIINHLENGRIQIHQRHLEKLLDAYNATMQTFQMFASGSVALPQDLRAECLEIIRELPSEQIRTAHPVLLSLSAHK